MYKKIIGATIIGSMIGAAIEKIYWSKRIDKSMDRAYEIGFKEGVYNSVEKRKEDKES